VWIAYSTTNIVLAKKLVGLLSKIAVSELVAPPINALISPVSERQPGEERKRGKT
jgi:hypothetical protein